MILTNFYTEIMNRLMNAGIGVAHFDLWNDQIREEEQELPVNFPALFLEYEPQEWVTLGKKKQQAEITFKLHICSELFGETAHREGAPAISASLAHLNLLDNIFYQLQGFNTTNIGSITRTGLSFSTSYGNIKEDVLDFKSLITDEAAMITYTPASPDQKITI